MAAALHSVRTLPHDDRKSLLAGPTIILIVAHSGSYLDYFHQCAAAKGIVHAARRRQLNEQMQSGNRLFKIEVPRQAFAAASPDFRQWLNANPHATHATLDLGPLLPGYAMCVLDWLVRVLQHKDWYDFASADASIEGADKWYRIYSYAAMCSLGMTEFADSLQAVIQRLVCAHDAVKYYDDYVRLLRVLNSSDPFMVDLAKNTAQQLVTGATSLSEMECSQLASSYPLFGEAVNARLTQRPGMDTASCATGDDAMEQ
jgi:hypothetical protein